MVLRTLASSGAALMLAACAGLPAVAAPDEVAAPSAERVESPLSFLFGEWVGTAKGVGPDRVPYEVVQTERVGPMLGGDVTVIEGRGYGTDGSLVFNAFAVVSKNAHTAEWEMRSYSGGNSGTFPFEVTETGFIWSVPAGPAARIVYTATVADGVWDQVGEYLPEDGYPVQVFEMKLVRTGESSWPWAGYVAPPAAD